MLTDKQVARYQAVMLSILAMETKAETIKSRLLEKITEPIFVDYIESMDNSMLETAAILTKKWGVLKWYPWDCEDFY